MIITLYLMMILLPWLLSSMKIAHGEIKVEGFRGEKCFTSKFF
jgi:hypothetical protein